MQPLDRARLERLRQLTGIRLGLKRWETITNFHEVSDTTVMVTVETYVVKELVREDRYERKGTRFIVFTKGSGNWYIDNDITAWDESFTPIVWDNTGRRKTAQELADQREWEMLCHRPGTARTPLDSYERVLDGCYSDSEKKMEGYY